MPATTLATKAAPMHDHAAISEAETAPPRAAAQPDIWSAGATDRLQKLWASGSTGGEIAGALSETAGQRVTRSAVMSKINRLGLVGLGGVQVAKPADVAVEGRGVWRDPAIVSRLRALWTTEGQTAEAIATTLSQQTGQAITRRAILRKLARMGLSGQGGGTRAPTVPKATLAARTPVSAPVEALPFRAPPNVTPPPAPTSTDPRSGRWTLADMRSTGQCKWPCAEEGGRHLFCGEPAPIGPGNPHGSWCPAHRARVFTVPPPPAGPSLCEGRDALNEAGDGATAWQHQPHRLRTTPAIRRQRDDRHHD
ncbi:GcrA family cell cycle regulator [Methylobacterium thuringiense]|uniref:GcrA cell cycle regulator n=1 Tax=Methylobacterium thuringiense TaxID=1003091 RepID=A0ABQ4TIX3_9HYPH|nr:GcrA family cell cycle regulator [Methylobacterium thuringiense]GJE54558.1 hypothetical protein EKPJFOCH_1036 [Methylobacterium thuringiense]